MGGNYGFIGGGACNTVSAYYIHSSIVGGNCNIVGAHCAAILGGCGNTDSGYPNIGMYGCGLTVTVPVPGTPSSFWVDTLVAPSVPLITTVFAYSLLPPGALYYINASAICGGQPLYIK